MWETGLYHEAVALLVALEAGKPGPPSLCGLLKHLHSLQVASSDLPLMLGSQQTPSKILPASAYAAPLFPMHPAFLQKETLCHYPQGHGIKGETESDYMGQAWEYSLLASTISPSSANCAYICQH